MSSVTAYQATDGKLFLDENEMLSYNNQLAEREAKSKWISWCGTHGIKNATAEIIFSRYGGLQDIADEIASLNQ